MLFQVHIKLQTTILQRNNLRLKAFLNTVTLFI